MDLNSIKPYFDIKSIVHTVSKYFFVQSQTSLMLYKVPLFFWKPLKYEQLKQDSSRYKVPKLFWFFTQKNTVYRLKEIEYHWEQQHFVEITYLEKFKKNIIIYIKKFANTINT